MAEAIRGLNEIKAKLRKLDSKTNVKIHKAAARSGATALKKNAITRLSAKHKKKLGVRLNRTLARQQLVAYKIGPYKEHWALAFQEFGVPGHWISNIRKGKRLKAKPDGKPLKAMVIGGNFIRGRHWHKGVKKTKFLSRAVSDGKAKALEAVGKRYWARINKLL